jgi:hypothetical protein
VYTAGVVLPKPVAQNRYYHRSLNPKKLIEVILSPLLSPLLSLFEVILCNTLRTLSYDCDHYHWSFQVEVGSIIS